MYYESLYDGKVIVLKKEYFLIKYQADEEMTIYFHLDGGRTNSRVVPFVKD